MSSNLFIITAPSGAGKTTLIKKVLEYAQEHNKNVVLSVSHTTRPPRDGEEDGVDYLFISEDDFKQNIENGEYIEYANVHGNYYGTPRSELDKNQKQIQNVDDVIENVQKMIDVMYVDKKLNRELEG